MADDDNLTQASGDADVKDIAKTEPSPPPTPPKVPDVELTVDGFGLMPPKTGDKRKVSKVGTPQDNLSASSSNVDIVRRYTWKTKNRMIVQVITYGATITSIKVPDRNGVTDDVAAGFDTLEEYFDHHNPYFGATIGRYANIIRDGIIYVKPSGKMYMLSTNFKNQHHYNGGFNGFDKVNWKSYIKDKKVIMSHVSQSFEEGYPGTVMVQVTFEVTCDNTIKIEMKCNTTEPTVVNISNFQYFNLGGHHAGPEVMYDHIITINGDKYTAIDDDGLVTGEKKVVGGTIYDFRIPRVLKTMITRVPKGGYDINYCVTQGVEQDLTFQARALHPVTGRVLEVYSNQPGMQFYTGNHLPDPDRIVEMPAGFGEEYGENEEVNEEGEEEEEEDNEGKRGYGYVPLYGKGGCTYRKHGLFCMRPQNYPDAANHKNFPNSVLNPGETYCHRIQYKFGLLLGKYV